MTDFRGPPIDLEDLPYVVADLQAQAQAQFEEKQLKAIIEATTKTFDRSTAYANVILVAGYAGAFTIWSFTRPQLPPKAGVAVALALLISLAIFITFEVVKMIFTAKIVRRNIKIIHSDSEPSEKLSAIKAIENANTSVVTAFNIYWAVTMFIAVGGALVAFALLAWNFLAVLIGWPCWPA